LSAFRSSACCTSRTWRWSVVATLLGLKACRRPLITLEPLVHQQLLWAVEFGSPWLKMNWKNNGVLIHQALGGKRAVSARQWFIRMNCIFQCELS
jgi:hypothetical protein